jgi:hypothetical protein
VDHLRLLDMLTQLGHGTLQDHGGLPPGLGRGVTESLCKFAT